MGYEDGIAAILDDMSRRPTHSEEKRLDTLGPHAKAS